MFIIPLLLIWMFEEFLIIPLIVILGGLEMVEMKGRERSTLRQPHAIPSSHVHHSTLVDLDV